MMLGLAYINLEKYEEAAESLEKAIQQPNAPFIAFVYAAATLAHLGRIDEARAMLADVRKRKPDFSTDTVRNTIGQYGPHSDIDRIIGDLGKAGLPD